MPQPSDRKRRTMGRQVNFYMGTTIETDFINYLAANHFSVLKRDLNGVKAVEEIREGNGQLLEKMTLLYKGDYGKIVLNGENQIDFFLSPIIHFSRTIVKYEQKKIIRGRLWISGKSMLDKESGKLVLKDFVLLSKWIKKHIPYQELEYEDSTYKEYIDEEIYSLYKQQFKLQA